MHDSKITGRTISCSPQGPGAVPSEALDGMGARAYVDKRAAKYFDDLARLATAAGVTVDVLAAVSRVLNIIMPTPIIYNFY